jgi:hypothetical protein
MIDAGVTNSLVIIMADLFWLIASWLTPLSCSVTKRLRFLSNTDRGEEANTQARND